MTASLNEGQAISREDAFARLSTAGYTTLPAATLAAITNIDPGELEPLRATWNALPRDTYLRDGGSYRFRRHSCFVHSLASVSLAAVARRPHWQPTTYNALHGGIERWFEPIEPEVTSSLAWRQLLLSLGSLFGELAAADRWHIEAHQFRIDATSGIGRPTPEGAHRDGVDFVAVILVGRCNVRGGETHVFDANGPAGTRFTLQQPWTALLMDDTRVIHETTPIQPEGSPAFRDTLVLTYRAHGFQEKD